MVSPFLNCARAHVRDYVDIHFVHCVCACVFMCVAAAAASSTPVQWPSDMR